MITTFLFLIVYIYFNYCKNPSISNIITSDECKYIILIAMIVMNIFTILYEFERKDNISLLIIIFLLIGIYGVIFIKEENNIHYVFAAVVFLAIISFMIKHFLCNKKKENDILFILLLLQSMLFIITLSNLNNNIFFLEVFYIITFAVFYIVLHFTNNRTKSKKIK
jgi:hypothetical protein